MATGLIRTIKRPTSEEDEYLAQSIQAAIPEHITQTAAQGGNPMGDELELLREIRDGLYFNGKDESGKDVKVPYFSIMTQEIIGFKNIKILQLAAESGNDKAVKHLDELFSAVLPPEAPQAVAPQPIAPPTPQVRAGRPPKQPMAQEFTSLKQIEETPIAREDKPFCVECGEGTGELYEGTNKGEYVHPVCFLKAKKKPKKI